VFILLINSFYSILCCRFLIAFNKNLDSYKETYKDIPVVAIANTLTTTLVTPEVTNRYDNESTPSTTSEYSSPSATWTSINTPLANATYEPPRTPHVV
jgi:hypothetical protein